MALNGNDLGIFLKAVLDPLSLKDIKTEISNLQNLFDKSPIKIKLDVDNNEFKAFQANIEKLSKNITAPVDFKTDLTGVDSFVVKLKQVTGEQSKQTEIITKGKNELNQEVSILNKLDNEGKNVASTFVTITDNTKKTTKELETQLSLYKQKMLGGNGFTGEIDIFAKKQKGNYDKDQLENLKNSIKGLSVTTPELQTKINQLGIEFSSMRQQAAQSSSVLTRTMENFYKFARFYIAGGFIVGAIGNFKNAMETLKEIDSQMVEIAKVTNLSADAMAKLKDSSFDTASDFGRKAQDYLSAVTEFSRAGYELQSAELSKVSLLAQNVGELTAEQANEFLLATDAAYKYKGSQEALTRVLDGVNQIDNKFATSISKVSEGITRAGSIASDS
jgi:DNA repair ATPase RecN